MSQIYHLRLQFFKYGVSDTQKTVKIEMAGDVKAESFPVDCAIIDTKKRVLAADIPFLDTFEFSVDLDTGVYPIIISTADTDVGLEDVWVSVDGTDWRSLRANARKNTNSDESLFYPGRPAVLGWNISKGHDFESEVPYTFNIEVHDPESFDVRYTLIDRKQQLASMMQVKQYGINTVVPADQVATIWQGYANTPGVTDDDYWYSGAEEELGAELMGKISTSINLLVDRGY